MDLREKFLAVRGESELMQFLHANGFRRVPGEARWNLGEFEARTAGVTLRVGYRWYDPSQAFSIQRDIHKAELWSIDQNQNRQLLGQIEFDEGA